MRCSAFHRVLSSAMPRSPSARSRVSSWLRQAVLGPGGHPWPGVYADTGSVVALVGQRGQPEEGGRGVQRAEEAGGAGGGEVMR